MNIVNEALSSDLVYHLGWMLLHSLWLMAALAIVTGVALKLVPTRFCNLRYVLSSATLALMLCSFTLAALWVPPRNEIVDTQLTVASGIESSDSLAVDASIPAPQTLSGEIVEQGVELLPPAPLEDHPDAFSAPTASKAASEIHADESKAAGWQARLVEAVRVRVVWIVPFWLIGVFAVGIWHLGGLIAVRRLRSLGTRTASKHIQPLFDKMCERMGVRQAVTLLESAVVPTPVVIGWFKPVILIPTSVITGMSIEQLEVIIAHELAHIRRHDHLINLVQTLIVTLLFYHPAVWWISSQIRIERECCCDAMVVKITDRKLDYAQALAHIATMRAGHSGLMVAANGSSLVERLRRIAGLDDTSGASVKAWVAGLLVLLLILAVSVTFVAMQGDGAVEEIDDTSAASFAYDDPTKAILGKWYVQYHAHEYVPDNYWITLEFREDGIAVYSEGSYDGQGVPRLESVDVTYRNYEFDNSGRLLIEQNQSGDSDPFWLVGKCEFRSQQLLISTDELDTPEAVGPAEMILTRAEWPEIIADRRRMALLNQKLDEQLANNIALLATSWDLLTSENFDSQPRSLASFVALDPSRAISPFQTDIKFPEDWDTLGDRDRDIWLSENSGVVYLPLLDVQKIRSPVVFFERPLPGRESLYVFRVLDGRQARVSRMFRKDLDALLEQQIGKGLDAWVFEEADARRAEAAPPAANELDIQGDAIQSFNFWIAPASFEPPNVSMDNPAQHAPGQERPVCRTAEPFITLSDIAQAEIVERASTGPVFELGLRPAALQRLQDYARERLGEPILISMNGELVSVPIANVEPNGRIHVASVNPENRAVYESVVRVVQRAAADRTRITGTWITRHNSGEEGPHSSLLTLSADGQWTTADVWGTPHEPTAVTVNDRYVGWDLNLSMPMFTLGTDPSVGGPVYSLNLRLDEQSLLGRRSMYFIDGDTFRSFIFRGIVVESVSRRVVTQEYPELLAALKKAVAEYEAQQANAHDQGTGEQLNHGDAVVIHQLSNYNDGGTLGVAYTPPGGERIEIAIDGRIAKASDDGNTYLRLYTGAMHPDHDEAKLVDQDSQLEQQVFAALISWVDAHFMREEVDAILREPNIDDLSEQERWALRIETRLDDIFQHRQLQKFAIFPASYDKDEGGQLAVGTPETRRSVYYSKQTQILTLDDIADARLVAAVRGDPLLQITLKAEGARRLEEYTRGHQADALLIMIDGKPVCAPIICGVMKGQFEVLSVADDAQERFKFLIDLVHEQGRDHDVLSIKPTAAINDELTAANISASDTRSVESQSLGEQEFNTEMSVFGLAAG